jgi:hypothetical protein
MDGICESHALSQQWALKHKPFKSGPDICDTCFWVAGKLEALRNCLLGAFLELVLLSAISDGATLFLKSLVDGILFIGALPSARVLRQIRCHYWCHLRGSTYRML